MIMIQPLIKTLNLYKNHLSYPGAFWDEVGFFPGLVEDDAIYELIGEVHHERWQVQILGVWTME